MAQQAMKNGIFTNGKNSYKIRFNNQQIFTTELRLQT